MDDPKATYQRLCRLAEDSGVSESPDPLVDRQVLAKTDFDRQTAWHVAQYLGLDLLRVGRGKRPRVLWFRGPEQVGIVAQQLYERHRDRSRLIADVAVAAYLLGAMPVPRTRDATAKPDPSHGWLVESIQAAHRAGRASGSARCEIGPGTSRRAGPSEGR